MTDNVLYARMELRLNEAERRLERFQRTLGGSMSTMERRTQRASSLIDSSFARSSASMASNVAAGALAAGLGFLSLNAIIDKTKQALDEFGDIADKSATAGLDAEFFQELAYQASLAGVGIDELAGSLSAFNKNSGLAIAAKGKMVASLKVLNPALLENIRNAKSQEERVKLVADAIDKEADASRKAAIASAAFGDVGAKLVSVFTGGAAAMEKTAAKARELGIIISNDTIARADELGDEFETATKAIDLEFKQSLINLAPILVSTASVLAGVTAGVADFVDRLRAYENQSSSLLKLQQFQIGMKRLDIEKQILEAQQEQREEIGKLSSTANSLGFADTQNPALPGVGKIDELKKQNEELGKQAALIDDVMFVRNQAAAAGDTGKNNAPAAVLDPITAPGASKTRNAAADDAVKQAEAVADLIANLEFERSLVGKTEVEQAQMNALRQAGAAATDEQKQKIMGLIDATAKETAAIAAANDFLQMQKDIANGMLTDIRGALEDGKITWQEWGDVASNVLGKIADKLQSMLVDQMFTGSGFNIFSLFGLGTSAATGGGLASAASAASVAKAVSPSAAHKSNSLTSMPSPNVARPSGANNQEAHVVISVDDEGAIQAYVKRENVRTATAVAVQTQKTFKQYRRTDLRSDIGDKLGRARRRG